MAKTYLAEKHVQFYRALFSEAPDSVVPVASVPVEDTYWRMEQLPRRERGLVEALVYALHDLCTRNGRSE
jgi:hypothetical protein